MNFITVNTYEELSKKGAAIIASQVILKPNCVIGLATGSSPLGIYASLAAMNEAGCVDFSNVTTVNLDEYAGLEPTHDQSYRYFMDANLFSKINIDKNNTHVPNGVAADLVQEGLAYDEMIRRLGGIDLQLLGIGVDGHIGFNEPDSCFIAETHPVTLDESTIDANARFFQSREDVPRQAITMGMGAIMQAKKILLVANGEHKKAILEKAMFGPIDPQVPASILQLHPDVTVIYTNE